MSVSRYPVKYAIWWIYRCPLKPQIGLHSFHFSNTLLWVLVVLTQTHYFPVWFFFIRVVWLFDHSTNTHFVWSYLSLFASQQYSCHLALPWCGSWIWIPPPPPLDWICHEVHHHLIGMTILQTGVSFLCSVLYEEISDIGVFCSAWAWHAAVLFEQHCAHVVLIKCFFVHFGTLVLEECLFPQHFWWRLVDPNQLADCWTCRVDFLFFNALVTQPFLMDIVAPVCPFRLGWVLYDASTHQWTTFRSFLLRCIFTVLVATSR